MYSRAWAAFLDNSSRADLARIKGIGSELADQKELPRAVSY